MRIEEMVRKCVVLIGFRMADDTFRFAGSGFWFGRDVEGETRVDPSFVVTARHVIEGIRKTATDRVWLRLNYNDGSCGWFGTALADWYVHPTDRSIDVATFKANVPVGCDHLAVRFSGCFTPEFAASQEISLGDEVFIVGLFAHHLGTERNIPIVRIGNLAARDEEKIDTRDFGQMDAYLIEARSIGGLSGSPVFLNPGHTRMIGGKLKTASGHINILLGLVHGHYDVEAGDVDEAARNAESVNTGIAMVVPIHSIMAVIDSYEREHPPGGGAAIAA
jgi:hypothetical protein